MQETLSSIFQRTRGAPVEVSGNLVRPIFEKKIAAGRHTFLARRMRAPIYPISGLCIKVVKGELEINGQCHSEFILWADTSPDCVQFSVLCQKACDLKIWNVWRARDIVQAWVGNAGMVVSEEGNVIHLECSGGTEKVDFSSLIFHIEPVA